MVVRKVGYGLGDSIKVGPEALLPNAVAYGSGDVEQEYPVKYIVLDIDDVIAVEPVYQYSEDPETWIGVADHHHHLSLIHI